MAFPVLGALSVGGSILGRLFGSKGNENQGLSKEDEELLMQIIGGKSMQVGMPDKGAWQANSQAQINNILGDMPVGRQAFNADLSSRGMFSSGEAPKNLYRNVYAPIARAATMAGTQGMRDYEGMRLGAEESNRNRQMQALQMLISGRGQNGTTGGQQALDLLGEAGDFGTKYSLMKMLGLMGQGRSQ